MSYSSCIFFLSGSYFLCLNRINEGCLLQKGVQLKARQHYVMYMTFLEVKTFILVLTFRQLSEGIQERVLNESKWINKILTFCHSSAHLEQTCRSSCIQITFPISIHLLCLLSPLGHPQLCQEVCYPLGTTIVLPSLYPPSHFQILIHKGQIPFPSPTCLLIVSPRETPAPLGSLLSPEEFHSPATFLPIFIRHLYPEPHR